MELVKSFAGDSMSSSSKELRIENMKLLKQDGFVLRYLYNGFLNGKKIVLEAV